MKKLIDARKAAGLDQVKVASKLGKSQSYISKIESGQRRLDIMQLKEFAVLYGKPLNYFIHE
ncbi:MAG: helix-turn-helix transcriptional regulator [Candidatus Margulisiibacteriota bacterium]